MQPHPGPRAPGAQRPGQPSQPSPVSPASPASPASPPSIEPDARARARRLTAEIWIVLGLSLGQSAVYAIVDLIGKLTARVPLAQQTAALNTSASPREYLDLTYQVLGNIFPVLPAVLALYLLSAGGRSATRRIGFDLTRPARDLGWGAALAAAIGIPGLAFYLLGRALGFSVEVQASGLAAYWWTVPVLILSALKNGLIEELVVVGYLMERLRELRWRTPAIFAASALLRGSYHLYQGWGAFVGNAVMGLVFCEFYRRRGRTMPLVIAHTLLDIAAFVGYALIPASLRASLGLA